MKPTCFFSRLLPALSLVLALTSSVRAQDKAAVPTGFAPPVEVQKTMNDIADLDLLKALVPVKLTADQLKKLVEVMKTTVTSLEARRKEEYDSWRAIAEDVAKAHADALSGTPVPADTEAKIVKTIDASEKRAVEARRDAISRIFAVVREILTPEQKSNVEKQVSQMLGGKRLVPPEYRANPAKAPKEAVTDLMVQVFVERILLSDRALDLLQKLKPAEPAETKPADSKPADAPPAGDAPKPKP